MAPETYQVSPVTFVNVTLNHCDTIVIVELVEPFNVTPAVALPIVTVPEPTRVTAITVPFANATLLARGTVSVKLLLLLNAMSFPASPRTSV